MAKSVNGNGTPGDENGDSETTTPICRCRVLYLGSAVPHITKDGLQGIQEPLRDLYPEQGVFWNTDRDHSATGIDSWLSVWSNGILVENVDDKGNTIRRFHPIESLHYCAAVRFVSVPAHHLDNSPSSSNSKNGDPNLNRQISKFLPLDSPFSKSTMLDPMKAACHPPLFACILRRTSGIKVLECHAFICKKEAAANALVRCCFHAYADTMHAKQIELESPYEQLDKRRSRSIGSALDSQSLIEDKVNTWQKTSTGGSSSGSPDEANGFGQDTRSISRQKQPRTPSVASLVSHTMAPGDHPHGGPMHHPYGPEPIYYPTGTLRSVRSFISLAALKSHKKRPHPPPPPFMHRGPPMPIAIPGPIPAMPPGPPPVMFATLSKKELKKVLKKESTLKRKHKFKDGPQVPFLPPPNSFPIIYAPPPMGPAGAMPLYAPLPQSSAAAANQFYGTIDSRKGSRIPLPIPPPALPPPPPSEPGNMLVPPPPSVAGGHFVDEPIYMPALPSPNGTLRPVTPHGEPIYLEGRNGPPIPLNLPPGPPPMFVPHPQIPGQMMPCTLVPTLSRKELKELEKQKAAMKKAAKKEKKKAKKGQLMNGVPHVEEPPSDYYATRSPYGYPPEEVMEPPDPESMIPPPSEMQLSSGNYSSASTAAGPGVGGGIYKKKGHLNERAFSYSIRQEHRSRSNSLSNLAFENGHGENCHPSHNASSISLKSADKMMNGDIHMNGNGRVPNGNGHPPPPPPSMMDQPIGNGPIDPNQLASRMSSLSLKSQQNGFGPTNVPPPPPLPPTNGYHQQQQQYQRTATIKRL